MTLSVGYDFKCFNSHVYGKPNAHYVEKYGFAEKNLVLRFHKPGFALINQVFSQQNQVFQ